MGYCLFVVLLQGWWWWWHSAQSCSRMYLCQSFQFCKPVWMYLHIHIYICIRTCVCVCVCAVNFNLFMLPLELRECHLFRRSVKVRTRMPDRRGGNLSFGLFHVAREWSTEGQIWYDMMWHLNSPVVLSWLLGRSRWNHVESRGFCYWIFCFLFSVISGIYPWELNGICLSTAVFFKCTWVSFRAPAMELVSDLPNGGAHAIQWHIKVSSAACECVVAVTCVWFWVCNTNLRV